MQLKFTFSYFICPLLTRTNKSDRRIGSDDFFDAFHSVLLPKSHFGGLFVLSINVTHIGS